VGVGGAGHYTRPGGWLLVRRVRAPPRGPLRASRASPYFSNPTKQRGGAMPANMNRLAQVCGMSTRESLDRPRQGITHAFQRIVLNELRLNKAATSGFDARRQRSGPEVRPLTANGSRTARSLGRRAFTPQRLMSSICCGPAGKRTLTGSRRGLLNGRIGNIPC
jgi:hypothetical protein